jgi:cation:H+ antiporter
MALTLILFLIGFGILIKGADLLVDGASSVANRFNVSNIVIGLTIVAFGTSMPELVVNLFASFQGNADIAIGNILGSNIANILLILGISSMIYPLAAKRNTVLKEIPFSLLAALVMAFMANDILLDGAAVSEISRSDGLVFLSFFAVFIYYSFSLAKEEKDIEDGIRVISTTRSIVYILLGLLGLVLGGKWIVDGAVVLAGMIGLSEAVIGLTVVAIGTSLPELATSAIAAYKKQSDIAIGNVVGSNIFNLFWILGCSSVIRPLPFNAASNYDVLATVLASLVLFLIMFVGKRHIIQRWQGGAMLVMYISYTIFLLINSH